MSGKDLPRAPSCFDLTGEAWRPAACARSRIPARELAEIDALAHQVADRFNVTVASLWGELDAMQIAEGFSDIAFDALETLRHSLDVVEVFIAAVIRGCDYPIVFARDTGPHAGYVSRSLSTHVLAFPEQIYMCRLGGMTFSGPFSTFDSMGGWGQVQHESYCDFANEEAGRDVLEISKFILDPDIPIRDARDWVCAHRSPLTEEEARDCGFGLIAGRACNSQERCRSWDDVAENALRSRTRGLAACLAPPDAMVSMTLCASPTASFLHCSTYGTSAAFSDPRARLLKRIVERIDLSGFRAVSPEIQLFDDGPFTAHERIAGTKVLLALCDELGIDTGAVSDAMGRKDFATILRLVSPEDDEKAWHEVIVERGPEASLVQHGLTEDELPY